MGAWGAGVFDNDDAVDWLSDFSESDDMDFVEETLEMVTSADADFLEAPDCANALAAAEVIAAIKQAPADDLPEEVTEWAEQHQRVGAKIVQLAVKAVQIVKNESELKQIWEDSDSFDDWIEIVTDLEKRLKQ